MLGEESDIEVDGVVCDGSASVAKGMAEAMDVDPDIGDDDNSGNAKDNKTCINNTLSDSAATSKLTEAYTAWLQSPVGGSVKTHLLQRRTRTLQRVLLFLMPCKPLDISVSDNLMDFLLNEKSVHDFLELERIDRNLGPSALMDTGVNIREFLQFAKYYISRPEDDVTETNTFLNRFVQACSREKKKRAISCNNLELLVHSNKWCTLERLQVVIPFHLPKYSSILQKCKKGKPPLNVEELTFAVSFIITYLFLKVKGTRPATYEYLTLSMVQEAKNNEGIIDQTKFKTAQVYLFDCMQLSDQDLQMLDEYIQYIRPSFNPKCDRVLLNSRNGGPLTVGKYFSKLVEEATGFHITPTTYRKIIETESDDKLDEADKAAICEDQKHSSGTAKRHYRLRRARNAAKKAKHCMSKLLGQPDDYEDSCISEHLTDTNKNK